MEKRISILVMDVDGTLTDGKIHISSDGELFKSFHAKDGYGIHDILPMYKITPVIITGRTSAIVERRAKELEIKYLYQNVKDKAVCLQDIVSSMGVSLEETACIGDDINDLPMLRLCSVKGCPSDAASEVKDACDYVCKTPGGHGAVREFVEWMIRTDKD